MLQTKKIEGKIWFTVTYQSNVDPYSDFQFWETITVTFKLLKRPPLPATHAVGEIYEVPPPLGITAIKNVRTRRLKLKKHSNFELVPDFPFLTFLIVKKRAWLSDKAETTRLKSAEVAIWFIVLVTVLVTIPGNAQFVNNYRCWACDYCHDIRKKNITAITVT